MKLSIQAVILSLILLSGLDYGYSFDTETVASPSLCVGCVLVTELIGQISYHKNIPIEDMVNKEFCELFPSPISFVCKIAMGVYGSVIIDGFNNGKNADTICKDVQFCTLPQCSLRPQGPYTSSAQSEILIKKAIQQSKVVFGDNIFDWIKDIIDNVIKKRPAIDNDGDNFSSFIAGLRGYNWRGKDCNDFDDTIYPGRKVNKHGAIDYSCNGIYGMKDGNQTWDDYLCKNSHRMGVAVLGDSAGAKFSIPPSYLNASSVNKDTYKNLLDVLINEIDQPYVSAFTGYKDEDEDYPSHSIYRFLRERNLCNHRDYQNLATNGARSSSVIKNSQYLARDLEKDHPLLLFLELIGNDVCSSHHSFDRMTKPEEFYQNMKNALDWLDTRLPNGSHVFILGLADGSVLYDTLWNETHPIGVPYYRVYDFLNCVGSNPCWGWLNSNKTVRDFTTSRAKELNKVYRKLIEDTKGKYHYDILYYDYPARELMDYWRSIGRNPADLIEAIDGFHPSGKLHSLLAEWMWDKILTYRPDWVGPINPHNNLIRQMFGDQGGH